MRCLLNFNLFGGSEFLVLFQGQIVQVMGVSEMTLEDRFQFCWEVCEESFHQSLDRGEQIDSEGVVVEVNEFKFEKRKYNHGHHVQGGSWGVVKNSTGVSPFDVLYQIDLLICL